MRVACAVCEAEIEQKDALMLESEEGEQPILVCSEECLEELEENPELYSPHLDDKEER